MTGQTQASERVDGTFSSSHTGAVDRTDERLASTRELDDGADEHRDRPDEAVRAANEGERGAFGGE